MAANVDAPREAGARAWDGERREFGLTAREEDLDAQIAAADEREAAADEREAAGDHRLRVAGLLDDETAAADRARALSG